MSRQRRAIPLWNCPRDLSLKAEGGSVSCARVRDDSIDKERAMGTTEIEAHGQFVERQRKWPSVAMIAGGAVMIAIWPIFTALHGPTSFNEGRELFGLESLLWSAMMEGPSLLLMAAGLYGSKGVLTDGAPRRASVGLVLSLIGLVVPAVATIAVLAVWPPLLAPMLGVGLILIASGQRSDIKPERTARRLLIAIGTTQIFGFLWFLVVRPDVLDQINGYRIYGIVANVLFGLLWIMLGISLLAREHAPNGSKVVAE